MSSPNARIQCAKLFTIVSAAAITAAGLPLQAFADSSETVTPVYPYILYAESGADDAVSVHANGMCVNGSIAANGKIAADTLFINGNYTAFEDAGMSMVSAHYQVLNTYFHDAVVFTDDVIMNEMNNNITHSIGTNQSFSAIGNVSMNGSVGAIHNITIGAEDNRANLNISSSVLYSRMGDVTLNCSSFSYGGLIYAPNGTVTINADNININGMILAKKIRLTGNNVNLNYNQSLGELIGACMDQSPESIANDPIFEIEKGIILDTQYLDYCGDGYLVRDGFKELNGELLMGSSFSSLKVEVFDDHGINVFTQDLQPELNWRTSGFGLLCGDNYVRISAEDENGEIYTKEVLLSCITAEYNGNLMIDRDDEDGDNLMNYIENYFGTDTQDPDTDDDGLNDYVEVYKSSTNPTLWDTDENGISDGEEDNDGDGLTNAEECNIGTLLYAIDTDADNLSDFAEHTETLTDPLIADTDQDGLNDADEEQFETSPLLYDTDGDGLSDGEQLFTKTLDIRDMHESYDLNVYPSLEFTGDAKNIMSVHIRQYRSDMLINPTICGYIGSAYTFTSDRAFASAVMTFTIDPIWFEEEDFEPAIYYFNEVTQLLEKLPDQTISGNTVSAPVEHFSTYIVLNSRRVDEVWAQDIDVSPAGKMELVFVMDYSTSLDKNDPDGYRVDVAKDFAGQIGTEDRIGVVAFNNSQNYLSLTDNIAKVKDQLEIIRKTAGSTNIWKGLEKGLNLFADDKEENVKRYVIFMSDGYDNSYNNTTYTNNQISSYKTLREQKKVDRVFVIALGKSSCYEPILKAIATSEDDYYKLGTDSDPSTFFSKAYSDMGSTTKKEKNEASKDSNQDGISDNDTELMCKGTLRTGTGAYVFGNPFGLDATLYHNVQSNDDFDGDSLINGDEITVCRDSTGRPYVQFKSNPNDMYSDNDKHSDGYEKERFDSDPNADEIVIDDMDVDYLQNGVFTSNEYFEKITGSVVEQAAVAVGNYAYDGEWNKSVVATDVMIGFLEASGAKQAEASQNSEIWNLLNDIQEAEDMVINNGWETLKNLKAGGPFNPVLLRKEFREGILKEYNGLLEDLNFLKKNRDVVADEDMHQYFNLLKKTMDKIDDFDTKYGTKYAKKLDNFVNGKFAKVMEQTGYVLNLASWVLEGVSTWKKFSELSATITDLEGTIDIMDLLYKNGPDQVTRETAQTIKLAATDSLDTARKICYSALSVSDDVVKFGVEFALSKALEAIWATPVSMAVMAGITIGTVVGGFVSPVAHRSEYAVRVCYATYIADVLANAVSYTTEYPYAKYTKNTDTPKLVGILKIEYGGKRAQSRMLYATSARLFAQHQVIDLLEDGDDANILQKGVTKVIDFCVGLVNHGESTSDVDEVIEIIEMECSYLNGMLNKYSQY